MQHDIQSVIKAVINLQDLTPNPEVNATMTQLVNCVIHSPSSVLSTIEPLIRLRVREMSAKAETEMEKFWATQIVESMSPSDALENFPYIDNYVELTRRELALAKKSGLELDASSRILIIGSGPLPLSGLEMHRQSGGLIDHVDISNEAVLLCKRINEVFSVASEYHCAMGQNIVLHKKYNLILIAALAGSTLEEKQLIINNVLPSLAEGGRIIIRSARGMRELLYPAIEASKLQNVNLLSEYHPEDHIINSVLIYGKEHHHEANPLSY